MKKVAPKVTRDRNGKLRDEQGKFVKEVKKPKRPKVNVKKVVKSTKIAAKQTKKSIVKAKNVTAKVTDKIVKMWGW
jgi:hypothetical protein